MEPTYRESESRLVCRLLVYVLESLGHTPSEKLVEAANYVYGRGRLDEDTAMLCGAIGGMTDEQRERIVYNAHHSIARELADWWERHQAADAKRLEEEKEAMRLARIDEKVQAYRKQLEAETP